VSALKEIPGQIVRPRIGELIKPPKALRAMLMKKLDIAELERAGRE
jgi:hypothetical protein